MGFNDRVVFGEWRVTFTLTFAFLFHVRVSGADSSTGRNALIVSPLFNGNLGPSTVAGF